MAKDVEELQKHPLFSSELPENFEELELYKAIQALKEDGTPSEQSEELLVRF